MLVSRMQAAWREDADRKFGEFFSIWLHIKAIRAFVEAVLRYGLPTDYSYAIITPKKGNEGKLKRAIQQQYKHMDEGFDPLDEQASAATDDSSAAQESALAAALPIVALPFRTNAYVHVQAARG